MSYTIQKYPVLEPLPLIERHDQLPPGAVDLGHCVDTTEAIKTFMLVKRGNHLSILKSWVSRLKTGDKYACKQFDYPLRVLSWFPQALEEFRRPPAQGGLHAGAMTTEDMDVDGEMLCIQSTTDGYALMNRSRNDHRAVGSSYRPIQVSLSYHFLYDLGFLDLWKSLGDKYERGEL